MKIIKNTKGRGVYSLTRHYEIVHTVGNEIKCPKCDKIFRNKYTLAKHNKKH